MTAKEYLRRLIDIDQDIQDYQDEILRIRTGMEKMTPQLSGMPMGSPDPDKLGGRMDGLIKWQDKLSAAVDEACRLKAEAMGLIDRVPDKLHRRILWKLYIAGRTLTVVAVDIGYEYTYTCHLHGQALQSFDAVLKEHNQTQLGM